MFDNAGTCTPNCPPRHVIDLIGSKWVITLLCCLQNGPMRSNELLRAASGISQKMLTQTLRELEHNGFVERTSHPEVPPRVEYRLTKLGCSLSALARMIEEWAVTNAAALMNRNGNCATEDKARDNTAG